MSQHVPTSQVLLLQGWQNADPAHWQSRWQAAHGYRRVEQHDWLRPLRGDWLMQLEEAVLQAVATPAPVSPDDRSAPGLTLAAHGLGCMLVAAWAAHSRHTHLVKAALLAAPADVEREALRPMLASWSPIPLQRLPFTSVLLGSRDDPHCSVERAQAFAEAWGSAFIDSGQRGHINAESGLGAWPQGHALLLQLVEGRAPGLSSQSQANPKQG